MMSQKSQRLCQMKAQIVAAVAHPVRLAIVEALRDGELCVFDIARQVGAQRSNVSRHLGVMVRAGLLRRRKDGLKVLYSLRTPCILKFLSCVTDVLREQLETANAVLKSL